MAINEINLFSLDNKLIASICNHNNKINVEDYQKLWKKIKKYNNVSKKNLQKIHFVPFNTVINLEFFTDIICSSYDTNFYVIYTKIEEIERSIYKIYNSDWFRCNFYDTDDSDDIYGVTGLSCMECNNCLCKDRKIESYNLLEKRILLYELSKI